ncbi:hypothetical protein Afil01_62090 [Actinorhabdospora filicis]|uniref:Capsid maturation protease n=1 Tax=Actinorhabdospora filicis TaxID=1785913 RepID=A0A9W6SSD2_9ACTN|nr:hypothetical protein [Actinorhabdospora filicis]GLZ81402.1 hypothetical protein Afil01_62090 [Actinorhabdospora filicis]
MTTPAREAEAERATRAYQLALAAMGVAAFDEAAKLWASMPATLAAATTSAWLRQAITLIMTRRALARSLAIAFYRLVRALRTGRTIADPRLPVPASVTLASLRHEFALLAPEYNNPTPPTPQPAAPVDRPVETPAPVAAKPTPPQEPRDEPDRPAPGDEPVEHIPVDVLDDEDTETDDVRQERDEIEARYTLIARGPHRLETLLAALDTDKPAKKIDTARNDAHRKAGRAQAASTARLVMNGARHTTSRLARRDRLVLGWIRRSTTGTPCDWCAMLLSRGAVYKSSASGGAKTAKAATVRKGVDRTGRTGAYAEGDLFHEHCWCISEQIHSREQYNSPAYDLNRHYAARWEKATKGHAGTAAVAAWRRFIRESRAQEARTVQETH